MEFLDRVVIEIVVKLELLYWWERLDTLSNSLSDLNFRRGYLAYWGHRFSALYRTNFA